MITRAPRKYIGFLSRQSTFNYLKDAAERLDLHHIPKLQMNTNNCLEAAIINSCCWWAPWIHARAHTHIYMCVCVYVYAYIYIYFFVVFFSFWDKVESIALFF